MSLSHHARVFGAIEAALRTISVDAGDGTRAIPHFERNPVNFAKAGVLPAVCIMPVSETYVSEEQRGADTIYAKTKTGAIVYIWESIDPIEDYHRIVHDVERALADWTLGGTVNTFDLVSNRLGVDESGRCEVTFEFEARYDVLRSEPGERI